MAVLADCRSKKPLERILLQILKTVNKNIEDLQFLTDERIKDLEERMTEVFNAPGMPGFLRAQEEWQNLAIPIGSP